MQNFTKSSWLNSQREKISFRKSLLAWFDQNQRSLPWRKNPSLYKTVVSEMMLQQTRVSTVLPYFENWMRSFPDFHALASASEESVLKAWEGLGYYSRARNLHKLSKIATNWKVFPQNIEDWKKLPGVGPYIAAAVTSISFGQANAVCDGNVVRVITRLFAIADIFKDGATAQKKLQPLAQQLVCSIRPGDYNQALMELGATICHRSSPLCTACPVLSWCQSARSGNAESYPRIKPKLKKTVSIIRYWAEREGKLLLYVSDQTRLKGVYELPMTLPNKKLQSPPGKDHIFTGNRTIGNTEYIEQIFFFDGNAIPTCSLPFGYRWVAWHELSSLTVSGPHRKWIEEIKESSTSPKGKSKRNDCKQRSKEKKVQSLLAKIGITEK